MIAHNAESAAAGKPTDGATGQPLRANPAYLPIYSNTHASAPDRFREAEGLELEPVDVPPDLEGISAVEDRAHTAAWHQYLSQPDDS